MWPNRLNTLGFLFAAASGIAACAHGQVLTPGEVGRSGSSQFSAPHDEVFYATMGALKLEGYDVATADVEKGVIVTKPKLVLASGETTGDEKLAPAQSAQVQRRYRVTVSTDNGLTRVVAEPFLARGDRDISREKVWDLDGPNGEKVQWHNLFDGIESAFRPASIEKARSFSKKDLEGMEKAP
jgi:hypothetical protein